jgi:hypothetical protein
VQSYLSGLLPETEEALFLWMAILCVLYLGAAYYLQYKKDKGFGDERFALPRVFDAITFSGSLMLLIGMAAPKVLHAIGSTKLFLLTAGLAGFVYGLHALKPR